jgi:hypothetical protein
MYTDDQGFPLARDEHSSAKSKEKEARRVDDFVRPATKEHFPDAARPGLDRSVLSEELQ